MNDNKYVTYQYNDCRDLRHSWESIGDTVLIETKGLVRVFSRSLKCIRCETVREDVYQMAGHLVVRVGAHYTYPKDYQVKGGLDVEELRWERFRNAKMVPKGDVG